MYEELYKAWRIEKLEEPLQPLDRDFYKKLSKYLEELKDRLKMMDEKTLKTKLIQGEDEKSRRLASELFDIRLKKIVEVILKDSSIPSSNLTEEEEELYRSLAETLENSKKVKKSLMEGGRVEPPANSEETKTKRILIRFTKEVPAIVCVDMKTYGPFKPEDIGALPPENAQALIRQGAAIKIETS